MASGIATKNRPPPVKRGGKATAFGPVGHLDETVTILDARQVYLDALPIAAAIVALQNRKLTVQASNAIYARLDDMFGEKRSNVLGRVACGARIEAVLDGTSFGEKFDWRDGGLIEGRHFAVSIAPLASSMQNARRALITLVDRTTEVETGNSLRAGMLNDSLTGLANRAGFIEQLEMQMSEDGDNAYGVVVVDLARFSRVNECIGSLGGDELIITVARRLISALRSHDSVARTGANEFALVVRLVNGSDDVMNVAQRIEEVLLKPCRLSDFEIKIDCAIGCALVNEDGADAETLMRHAQAALKTAKVSKRIEIYQPSALKAARRRFTIETELRRAIENGNLELAFQPLMSLATGKVTGFEALARWQHPEQGSISPVEFIAVAEDSGLIVPLGRWALDNALRTLASWDARAGRALPLYVGVNLSAIQMARDDIALLVGDTLAAHAMSGYRLSIELTESAIIADPDRAHRTLAALKSYDAMVAMDDFGTGFSNLASLQKLPIDTLKIDRSFITDMIHDPDKIAIVRAILSLAQALGMTTTAEGVETLEVARMLAALGATTGQGYLYAIPLVPDAAYTYALDLLG